MGLLSTVKAAILGRDPQEQTENEGVGERQEATQTDVEQNQVSYVAALQAERAQKDHFLRSHPYSPLEPETRQRFHGLRYYEPDPAWQYTLQLHTAQPEPITFQTNTGDEQIYYRLGTAKFEVEGEPAELTIYRAEGREDLFLPFRDATSGHETYGGGRYLEPTDLGNGELLVDFNLAYNPYCAYSPNYSCPLPPIENWLKVPIRAGEKKHEKRSEIGHSR